MITYYRSYRIINGKCKIIITEEDYNMISDQTTEQIKMAISGDPPRKCCICRETVTYVYPGGKLYWHNHGTIISVIEKIVQEIYATNALRKWREIRHLR